MTTPFAFQVAQPGTAYVPLGSYDAEQQEFMWEGDSEVTLGWPGCSLGPFDPPNCGTTSTACYFWGLHNTGYLGYKCDFY